VQTTLVTIGLSHYCEKARWALDRAGISYREEAYAPGTHLLGTLRRGGRSTPVLTLPDGTALTDSSDIVRHADAASPGVLLPTSEPLRREVLDIEERFDDPLGPAVRILVYGELLRGRCDFATLLRETTTGAHRALSPLLGLLVPRLVKRAFRIDDARIARSRDRIDEVLTKVEERLGDGRRYLAADRFTAADLTFAALIAPMIGPPQHPATGGATSLAVLEPLFARTRARPAGAFAMRMYAEERKIRA